MSVIALFWNTEWNGKLILKYWMKWEGRTRLNIKVNNDCEGSASR